MSSKKELSRKTMLISICDDYTEYGVEIREFGYPLGLELRWDPSNPRAQSQMHAGLLRC